MARRHRLALAAGFLLSVVALTPPILVAADARLSLHMLHQMMLLALVVPLLAYGAAPLLRRRGLGGKHPALGILALNLVLFGWQLPAVVDLALRNPFFEEAAELVFLLGAFLFWWPIVAPGTPAGGLSPIAKIGYLMVAGVPPTIPGMTLAFSRHAFYQTYRSIDDQQVAGLLLFGTAKFALVAGTFVILWRMLAPQAEPPDDRDHDAGGVDLPPSAPAWLRRLDEPLPAEPAPLRRPVPAGR